MPFLNIQRDQRPSEEGFTLVELMVVIVIIGLLATVVLINVLPSQDKAMVTKAEGEKQSMILAAISPIQAEATA